MRISFRVLLTITLSACARSKDDRAIGTTTHEPNAHTLVCGISDSTKLTGEGVGALLIGRSVAAVRDACHIVRDSTEVGDEASPERILTISLGRDTVRAIVDSARVWRIDVRQPRFRTSDSLGVGSSLARLLKGGDARGAEGESGLFILLANHCGLSFHIDRELQPKEHRAEWSTAHLARLPGSTLVDRVLISGCGK